MNILSKCKQVYRNLADTSAVLMLDKQERPIVVYSEDRASWNQMQGYVESVLESHGLPVLYITSAYDDPLLTRSHKKMRVFYIDRAVPNVLPKLDSKLLVMTMPDIEQFHIKRPGPDTTLLYLFHSLNSIHEVYRKSAFDHYDAFFCTGPHHKKELKTHFEFIGKPVPKLFEVGYYKLDRIAASFADYTKKRPERQTILVAPSWGKGNLLESRGIEIVRQLLTLDVDVIVRPHPCFFQPIYANGLKVVREIEETFGGNEHFTLERNINTEDSFHEADLMISDFSGAAFEYALGTLRPVLFVDVARKTMNPHWRELGLPTFEDKMRYEVGHVVSADEVTTIGHHCEKLLQNSSDWAEKLEKVRRENIYNFGCSSEVGATIVKQLLHE